MSRAAALTAPADRLLSVEEVMDQLGVSKLRALQFMRDAGWVRVDGTRSLIRLSALSAWLDAHQRPGSEPAPVVLNCYGRYVPEQVRNKVLARDRSICGICGKLVPRGEIQLDHIRPLARGGRGNST